MAKTTRKKPATTSAKAAKPPSDHRSRGSEGKASPADSKFQKEFGKASDTPRKG